MAEAARDPTAGWTPIGNYARQVATEICDSSPFPTDLPACEPPATTKVLLALARGELEMRGHGINGPFVGAPAGWRFMITCRIGLDDNTIQDGAGTVLFGVQVRVAKEDVRAVQPSKTPWPELGSSGPEIKRVYDVLKGHFTLAELRPVGKGGLELPQILKRLKDAGADIAEITIRRVRTDLEEKLGG